MNRITELKNKVTTYLDEHPYVKKGLKIGFTLLGAGVTAYAGYKIGTSSSKKNEVPLIPDVSDVPALPNLNPDEETIFMNTLDNMQYAMEHGIKNATILPDSIICKDPINTVNLKGCVVDDHTFDMTFTDVETGQKIIFPKLAAGTYVKDWLDMDDFPEPVRIENPVKEIAETAADIVEEVIPQDA